MKFLIVGCLSLGTQIVYASTSGVTYQGRILAPNGEPLHGQYTQFKLQIRTPDSQGCLMYEEIQTLDLRSSSGMFSLTMNDGNGARTDSTGLPLDRIFANNGTFTLASATCTLGAGNYTPNQGDGRLLTVHFKDETMSQWEPIPAQKINFVPFAFEANQVQGFAVDSLLRIADPAGLPQTGISPLSNAQYTELLALVNGTSTTFEKAGHLGGATLPSLGSAQAGQMLSWNGSGWTTTAAAVGADSVSTTSIVDGSISSADLATNIAINTTATIATSGIVSSNISTSRDFRIFDGEPAPNDNYISIKAPATLAANYNYVWPATYGSNNQVLTTDGAGALTWAAPGAASQWSNGTANAISYSAGNVGIGTATPAAVLHLKAGSSAAGTAPLKLSSGPLMTAPEDGAMEYDGLGIWFTIGSTRYLIPTQTSAGNYSNVQTIGNTTGSITMTPLAGNSVIVNAATVSTSSATGALVVSGGIGSAGAINASGNITSGGTVTAMSSIYSPQVYGSNAASGEIRIDGTSDAAKGNVLLASAGGNVGIGTTSPTAKFSLSETSTTTSGLNFSHFHEYMINPGSVSNGSYWGQKNAVSYTSAANLTGQVFGAEMSGQRIGGGDVASAIGVIGVARNDSAGTLSSAIGTHAYTKSTAGTITTATAGKFSVVTTTGSTTTGYGIYIDTIQATNPWGLYQSDVSARNYFGGNVGIGTSNPSALFQVGTSGTGLQVNGTGNITSIGGDTGATLSSGGLSLRSPGAAAAITNSSTASGSNLVVQGSSATNGNLILRSTGGTGSGDYVEIQGGSAGGTSIARFLGSGNVGIGTATPTYPLDVTGSIRSTSSMYGFNYNALSSGPFSPLVSYNSAGAANEKYWDFFHSGTSFGIRAVNDAYTASNEAITFQRSGNTITKTLIPSGNVGIGTTSPLTALDVAGRISGAFLSSSYTPALYLENPYSPQTVGVGPNVTFRGTSHVTMGSIGAQYESGANNSSLVFSPSLNNTAVESMRITSAGRVGIGTASPSYKLDVAGDVNVTGNFKVNGVNISSGSSSAGGATTQIQFNNAGSFAGDSQLTWDSTNKRLGVNDATPASKLSVSPGSGDSIVGGRAFIGGWSGGSQEAAFGHYWKIGSNTEYALRQNDVGRTIVNSAAGHEIGFMIDNTEKMRLHSDGSLGIGTTPSYRLHVRGTSGSTVAYFTDGVQSCSITPSTAGSITCSSDQRLKRDIASVSDSFSLERVLKLETVTYRWRSVDDGRHTGYIAQDVEKIAPEFVTTGKDGFKQVSYTGFIPLITGSIKELFRRVSSVDERVELMRKENEALKQRIERLEILISEKGSAN